MALLAVPVVSQAATWYGKLNLKGHTKLVTLEVTRIQSR
jgi:polyisoprenoid-binding protein YceI